MYRINISSKDRLEQVLYRSSYAEAIQEAKIAREKGKLVHIERIWRRDYE